MLSPSQQTLTQPITKSGIGLHSGKTTTVKLLPANSGEGRYFIRQDLPNSPPIPANDKSILSTTLSTELGHPQTNNTIRTVEHLLAALTAAGVDNVRIEIDGPEIPLLDGSAKPWIDAITVAGLISTTPPETLQHIETEIIVRHQDSFVAAIPSSELRFTYGIDFAVAAIGRQWYSWSPQQESFAEHIAPARTFTLEHQIKQLQQAGLIKGGSLDNALVCGDNGWLNPPLRFANEPVRHKIIDLVGDLSLLGQIPIAHYFAYKAGHHLHTQLVKQIVASR
ncbi:MAG: UDP-3-O-acyl-N-acetylglucosamine deacetylase [Microcoleaceae cyanobacterium]